MKKNKLYFFTILIVALALVIPACGGSSGGGGGGAQSFTITGESGTQVNLNGTWNSGCVADLGDGESEISVLTISGSSFSITQNHWFSSIVCSGTSDVTAIFTGAFTLGGELTATMNSSNVTATETDNVLSTSEGTVNNATTAADFNASTMCGFNDWVVGVPKDVLGTGCGPDSSYKDIVYIDDTADPDLLYSGNDDGPVDANGYPTDIDDDLAFERM